MTDEMRAVAITEFGGPEVLEVRTIDRPAPVLSEALIRVHAAGVNPIDAKTRSGKGMSVGIGCMPWIPGGEFAGVIEKASYELSEFQPGDEVFGMVVMPRSPGTYAEYTVAPTMCIAQKPEKLSMIEAGGVPVAALTAWAAVIDAARVSNGQRMLVHAGAGGVGHMAVQLAAFYGAHVITTASSENHAWLRELGAQQVIDYKKERFEDVITEPVDVVIDLIGNVHDETGTRSLSVLRDGGLIVNVPSGSWPSMKDEVAAAGRNLHASTLKVSPDGRALRTIAQLFDQGDLRTHVDAVFALEDAAAAHERIEQGHTRGKLVLRVD